MYQVRFMFSRVCKTLVLSKHTTSQSYNYIDNVQSAFATPYRLIVSVSDHYHIAPLVLCACRFVRYWQSGTQFYMEVTILQPELSYMYLVYVIQKKDLNTFIFQVVRFMTRLLYHSLPYVCTLPQLQYSKMCILPMVDMI